MPEPPIILADVPDDELIGQFIKSPLATAKELLKHPEQKQRLWQIMERNPANKALAAAYKHVEQILGPVGAAPAAQPQPTASAAAKEIPEYKPTETVTEKPAKKNEIGPGNAKQIEEKLNGLKSYIYDYFSKSSGSTIRAAYGSQAFTHNLLQSLSLYRGELAHFYLAEGAWEMIFSALGPIGDLMRKGYGKKIQWQMDWMKNPLNANAVYYYLNSLPTQKAFEVAFIPLKGAFGILARGGAPLISQATYNDSKGITHKEFVFTPFLRATQFADKAADSLDRQSGVPTDSFFGQYERFIEQKHKDFSEALKELDHAKEMGQPSRLFGAKRNAQQKSREVFNKYDGGFWQQVLRPGRVNMARRLREHHRDPISYLLAIVGGAIWDFIATLTIRPLLTLATRLVNLVPGVSVLRARLTQFLTSNKWLGTAEMGTLTGRSIFSGIFSPTTVSAGYLGYHLFPDSPIAQAILTPTFAGAGAYYNVAVKLANLEKTMLRTGRIGPIGWYREFEAAKLAGNDAFLQQKYFKSWLGRPGPLLKFSNFLYENRWLRLPINGWALQALLSQLPAEFLASKFLGLPVGFWINSLPVLNYLWQIKGWLAEGFTEWFSHTQLGNLISEISLSVKSWAFNLAWEPTAWESSLIGKTVTSWGLRPWANTLSKYFGSFFNPGFFAGIGLIQPLIAAGMNPILAAFFGPIAGSSAFLLGSRVLAAFAGKNLNFIPQINQWAWLGTAIGWGLDLIIPGNQFWLIPAFTYGLPVVMTFFPGLAKWFAGAFGSIGLFLESFVFGLAHGLGISAFAVAQAMALWSTVAAIASVAVLTIFFAYTVYASFWVPMQQYLHAGPESACFNLQTSATITAGGSAKVCSKFEVKQPGLLTEYGYLENNINVIYLDIDDDYPQNSITKANRNAPGENLDLKFDKEYVISPHNSPTFDRTKYAIYNSLCYQNPTTGLCQDLSVDTFLSTYTSYETGPMTLFDLQKEFPQFYGLRQISDGYVDLLNQINDDRTDGNDDEDTEAKLDASLDVIDKIIDKQNNIVKLLNSAQNQNDLGAIKGKINEAYALAEAESKKENNPFTGQYADFEAFLPSCGHAEDTCREIYGVYQSYSSFFQSQFYSLGSLKRLADNPATDLTELKAAVKIAHQQADYDLQNLKMQKQSLKETKDSVNDLYNDRGFWNDWLPILTNLTGVDVSQVQAMLLTAFKDFFTKKFYFTPGGTVYEVCVEGKYIGPTDRPVTFTSSVNIVQPGNLFTFRTNTYGVTQFNTAACTAISSVTVNP